MLNKQMTTRTTIFVFTLCAAIVPCALWQSGDVKAEETASLTNGSIACVLPSPKTETVGELPPPPPPVEYNFTLSNGGGFVVTIKGKSYPVESSYSYPHGGENRLSADGKGNGKGENQWHVATKKLDEKNYEVSADGVFYSINRKITLRSNRIDVRDTIRNKSAEVLGIILSNQVKTAGKPAPSVTMPGNYTIYIKAADHGLALVGLDDVYQLQQHTYNRDGVASMTTDKFGLDAGAEYTIEWAVYPTATPDYLEFINTFRKVEGLNRTIDGAFALVGEDGKTGPDVRSKPISPEEINAKGVKYVSYFYLISPADDPGASLEGIEFVKYPKESALLRKSIAETYCLSPGVKASFHIAHGLYFTDQPKQLFPDSRVIRSDGKQIFYGADSPAYYCRFISQKHFNEGYRWWIFYPTMENSFGRAILAAIDYMFDEIGAKFMYADGFFSGYAHVGGNPEGYIQDTWDGHSVEIDPATKTVKRKLGLVSYLSLPVLGAVVRKVSARGGVVITNGRSGPRSMWKENYFTVCETAGQDKLGIERLYIGPTIMPFGNPGKCTSRQGLYDDILAKLNFGALYSYFGDKSYAVKDPMIVRHMYPFTREETHAGWAKGRERIITRVPGVYGWQGDKHLHFIYRSDAKGYLVSNEDFSTADGSGVRTALNLQTKQSAIVEKIPVVIETQNPVNLLVRKYNSGGMELCANGRGDIRLILNNGKFPIASGEFYQVVLSSKISSVKTDDDDRLSLPLKLDGETKITVSPPKTAG